MNPNRRSDWPARRSAEPAPKPSHLRYAAFLLAFAVLAGCSDREPVTAPAILSPHLSQELLSPVVNSLADPGDGTCDDAGTGDGCTLREAIAFANPSGATVTFDPALTSGGGQVITLDPARGQLVIAKNLTIVGPGANLLTVRRAADAPISFRIIEIQRNGTSNVAVTIAGLAVSGGIAPAAGGIGNLVADNSLTLSRVIISGNTATGGGGGTGGGVYNLGILSIDSSTISGNNATLHAAGVMGLGGHITISNSTISDNHAGSKGGGIFLLAGTMSLQNVTISGNSADFGGGIAKESTGEASLTHGTVAGNTAGSIGGIWSLAGKPPITLSNTIVASNTGGAGNCGSFGPTAIADGGGNLVYPAAAPCDGIAPATTADPKLGVLTVNAPGLTATMALGAGSAAIDAGSPGVCTAQDQRGVARPQGVECDIGAYEAEPSVDDTPPVVSATIDGMLGSNGWYTTDVTVSWTVDDAESEVTSTPCAPTIISADTPGQAVACSATSAGGSSAETVTIKRDATTPSLAPTVAPSVVLLNGAATADPNALDALSGAATSSCGTVNTATVGTKSVSCSATDNAGNLATGSAAYAVVYQFVGFSGSVLGGGVVNVVKAGQTVPLKWRLLDATGAPVTNLTAASVAVTVANLTCSTGTTTADVVATAAGGGGGPALRNLGDGYYQFNWSTPKSYANTCKTMQLSLGEGTTRDALFRFTK